MRADDGSRERYPVYDAGRRTHPVVWYRWQVRVVCRTPACAAAWAVVREGLYARLDEMEPIARMAAVGADDLPTRASAEAWRERYGRSVFCSACRFCGRQRDLTRAREEILPLPMGMRRESVAWDTWLYFRHLALDGAVQAAPATERIETVRDLSGCLLGWDAFRQGPAGRERTAWTDTVDGLTGWRTGDPDRARACSPEWSACS